jgi:hypothetical protein
MKTLSRSFLQKTMVISILTDIGAMAFIYLVPAISHLLSLPVYLIEPMRLMLILAMVHTSKSNAYLLALSLPLFSLVISGHPVFPKMLLIAFELSMNVFLFYILAKRIKTVFPAILLSIVISKMLYYAVKFLLIRLAVIETGLVTTPILIQVIMTFLFSFYLYLFFRNNQGYK